MPTEADTCRTYVVPKLYDAGWANDQIAEQRTFTDGRILVAGRVARRGKPKRADYLLYYKPNYPLAVVEAKAAYRSPSEGLQQAKAYASTLGLPFSGRRPRPFRAGDECRLARRRASDEMGDTA